MKLKPKSFLSLITTIALLVSCTPKAQEKSLKDALEGKFLIGVAVNNAQVNGADSIETALITKHFNSIVAENCMKSANIHPEEHRYDFKDSDAFVKFGIDNGMFIIGHALLWHSQLSPWFCVDEKGNNVSPEVLKQRMKDHIHTVVGRYKGQVHGWDVVNEAIEDDGSWRNSKFYQILGEEYIPLAFQYAHEADPDAELYYNDYSMYLPGRRDSTIKMVNDLKARGLRVDAIGMQGHIGIDYPTLAEFEEAIVAFASTGAKVMITEWDMTAIPSPVRGANISDTVAYRKSLNPYTDGLPEDVSKLWNDRVQDLFELLIKYQDDISRFTAWGLSDRTSWKNNWPVFGRTEYPLLFDREYQPKPVTKWIMNL